MAKFTVGIGEEFVVKGVEIEDIEEVEKLASINRQKLTAEHQARITYIVMGFAIAAIVATAVLGWWDGSYNELATVWSSGSIWVGMVLGRYFKKD